MYEESQLRRGLATVNDGCTFLEGGYQLEVATSRAATLIVSLGNYVELFGLSSNPAPKIDLPLGDLEGRLDKEPAKNVKTASRENARQRGRLINMRYNLAFDAKSMGDSAKK